MEIHLSPFRSLSWRSKSVRKCALASTLDRTMRIISWSSSKEEWNSTINITGMQYLISLAGSLCWVMDKMHPKVLSQLISLDCSLWRMRDKSGEYWMNNESLSGSSTICPLLSASSISRIWWYVEISQINFKKSISHKAQMIQFHSILPSKEGNNYQSVPLDYFLLLWIGGSMISLNLFHWRCVLLDSQWDATSEEMEDRETHAFSM